MPLLKKYYYLLLSFPTKLLLSLSSIFCKIYLFRYAALCLCLYMKKNSSESVSKDISYIHCCEQNFISLIIPTYNRVNSLNRLLLSLKKQSLPQKYFEIIIINNACTDETQSLCEQFSNQLRNLRLVYEPTAGLLAARNSGVLAAKGEILTFCDDDIEPNPAWLSAIMNIMVSHSDIMLLGGNNKGAFEISQPTFVNSLWIQDEYGIRINPYYSLIENINQSMPAPSHTYIMGCNFTTRRSVVNVAQGFGPDCMPNIIWQGDGETRVSEVAEKMGKVWLDPKVSVLHWMPSSRLTKEYIDKRKLYFDIAEAYTNLRKLNFSAWKNGDDRYKNKNIYLQLASNIKELREWIIRESYFGIDTPHIKDIENFSFFFQRHGW